MSKKYVKVKIIKFKNINLYIQLIPLGHYHFHPYLLCSKAFKKNLQTISVGFWLLYLFSLALTTD